MSPAGHRLPAIGTLLLDSEGLAQLSRPGHKLKRLLERAKAADAAVVTPWTAIAEAMQGPDKARVRYALSACRLQPLTEQDYRSAAQLMDKTSMGGHTIDALVVVAALGLPRPVIIATSDPTDLQQLSQGERGIVPFLI